MTALITELKSMGFTTLGVIDLQMHPSEELHAILGLFEGEISIYEKENENGSGKCKDQENEQSQVPRERTASEKGKSEAMKRSSSFV
jgi:hypothetical protein